MSGGISAPMPTTRLLGTSVLTAFALVGLSACGQKTLKTSEAEASIKAQFKQQGIPLTEVDCPGKVAAKVGEPVSCTALNPYQTKLKLEGKITEVKADKSRFEVKAVSGTAQGVRIARAARGAIEKQVGQKAEDFTCPDEVPIPTTPAVTCELTAPGGKVYDAEVKVDAHSRIGVQVAHEPKSGG